MKIAQVTPLYEAVPPRLYGGTERVVAHLTDALVELGHDVTLFASAEAETKAHLIPVRDQAIRLDPAPLKSDLAAHLSMLAEVRQRAEEFDVIHFHTDMIHFPFFDRFPERTRPPEGVDLVEGMDGLPDLLATCDFVVIAAPHTPETAGLFGSPTLARMRPSAYLINIGRGAIVVLDDLVAALRPAAIAGAALDVFEVEPLPLDHPLWAFPNVILTPHTGGSVRIVLLGAEVPPPPMIMCCVPLLVSMVEPDIATGTQAGIAPDRLLVRAFRSR